MLLPGQVRGVGGWGLGAEGQLSVAADRRVSLIAKYCLAGSQPLRFRQCERLQAGQTRSVFSYILPVFTARGKKRRTGLQSCIG